MKKIGIFYGSDTGNTESIAKLLAKKLGVETTNVFDVGRVKASKLNDYDILFLGGSTQGLGDLQSDWDNFLEDVKKVDLKNKKVAVFGLGDSGSYSDTFCNSIGIIAEAAQKAGATLIGNNVSAEGYTFDDSQSLVDDAFCGLPLDEDNESDQTESRIDSWLSQLQL